MSFFMELAVLEETDGVPTLDFQTIKLARLDKLVADLTQCGEMPFTLAPRFVHDTVTAEKLERMWRERLKYDYLMIDEIRANDLAMKWRLKEGMPVDRDAAPGSAMGNKPEPINSPRNITTFKPGGYGLLILCCGIHRLTTSQIVDKPSLCSLGRCGGNGPRHNKQRRRRDSSLASLGREGAQCRS